MITLSILGFLLFQFDTTQKANAIGSWHGLNTIRVPIAWCAVSGSPVVTSPHVPNPGDGVDTTTDDVLWRRHERVTEFIYSEPVGITFRSAINRPSSSLSFPIIADLISGGPRGVLGDLDIAFDLGSEYVGMLDRCKTAWIGMTGGPLNGIVAINVRLFWEGGPWNEFDTIGIGACISSSGVCRDGNFAVVDNYFMFPGITSGTWNNDPFDQAVGHELGRALGLTTRSALDALMRNYQHLGPDGMVDNILLNVGEKATLRSNAVFVPGATEDPAGEVIYGDIVQSIMDDKIGENGTSNPYEDIKFVKVTLDRSNKTVAFGQELSGLLPDISNSKYQNNIHYWTFVDLDANKSTGADEKFVKLGVPKVNLTGADLAILANFTSNNDMNNSSVHNQVMGSAWFIKDPDNIVQIPSDQVKFDLQTMMIVDVLRQSKMKGSLTDQIPLYNIVEATLNNDADFIQLNKPFGIKAFVVSNGTSVDKLENETNNNFKTLELRQPIFPECKVSGNSSKGKTATIDVSGLLPDSKIYALIGPRPIVNGTTENSGNSTMTFVIPSDITPGLHLITVGVENTSLTADCEIDIQNQMS
ncbi:MAG: hypothetical protein ACHQ1D_03890 [Nitrososphaerales archaeon]